MDFPDMRSLKRCAKCWEFRQPLEDEDEAEYREALADYVQPRDFVEACEIRNKVGWDRFSESQGQDMLKRSGLAALEKE